MRFLGSIQRILLVSGVLLLGFYAGAHLHRQIMSRAALRRFEHLRRNASVDQSDGLLSSEKVDFTLWSDKRIAAYEESLLQHFDRPIAVLRIGKVNLEAPIFEGTDDLTLNRGVGHIPGTGRPGEEGNIGIAGHRDGFFRALKDIASGDAIELVTVNHKDVYTVDQIVLVFPKDVSVLQARERRSLTLVTCYPFYFVGSAPKRYIVHASLTSSEIVPSAATRPNELATSKQ